MLIALVVLAVLVVILVAGVVVQRRALARQRRALARRRSTPDGGGKVEDAAPGNPVAAEPGLANTVLGMASDAVVSTDSDGRIVGWNRGAEMMLGWSGSEVMGRDAVDTVIPEVLRAAYRDGMRNLRAPGAVGRVDEPTDAIAVRRDGTELPVEATAWIVDGQLTTLMRDASNHRHTERSLADGRERATQTARLKSEILARTSHELRTPTNGIVGMTGLLLETELDPTQRRYVESIRAAGTALLTVIDDVLDYSKVESGQINVEEVDFNLRELIEDVVALVAGTGRKEGVEVVGYCQPGLPAALRGDPGRLRQVLLNLAGNAVKFTDRGEVVVRATGGAAATREAGSVTVRFEVVDTGIGISAEDRDRLFDVFVRPDAANIRRPGGTGLGLAISKRLVELMGGRLDVDSEPNEGSTFAFEIAMRRQGHESPGLRSLGVIFLR